MKPLLSIVIANYNYGRFLEEAILSVLTQSCQDFELIVCDAASKDNSVEIIKKYADRIAWWCSEPDGGQSAAFNKGFSHANGRFLTWLNADDVMLPGVIEKLSVASKRDPQQEWFVGGVMWLTGDMKVIKMGRGRPFSYIRARAGNVTTWGPSSFFTKKLYERAGKVDERFHYAMDNDLWHRFYYKCGVVYKPCVDYGWGLRLHEEAKMSGHNFAGSSQQNPNHPKWKQLRQEIAWMEELYKPKHGMDKFTQLISMSFYRSIAARVDTLRYKGRYYLDACEHNGGGCK